MRPSEELESPLETAPSYSIARPSPPIRPWLFWPAIWAAVAASLVLVIGVAFLALRDEERSGTPGPLVVVPPAGAPADPAPVVATLTAEAGARWSDPASPTRVGTALAAGRVLDLRAGCVELTFSHGATVVVDGPARLNLIGPMDVSLAAGKLLANVPAGGFVVHTPASTITDLGTEFGVYTAEDGSSSVEVFAGSVRAAPAAEPQGKTAATAPLSRVLTAGQAAKITAAGQVSLDPQGAVPQRFVRRLSRSAQLTVLDVVDLMSGGDGTMGRRGYAIDPRNGAAGKLQNVGRVRGDGHYHAVPSLPVVDGCFIPAARGGPVQVDSAGHRYDFPASADGQTYNLIWLGGPVPGVLGAAATERPVSTRLGGEDYATAGRGLLALHAGKGLTIDLDEVRRLYPGSALLRFTCVAGNTWTPASTDKPGARILADLFVLVDGKPAFERRRFPQTAAPFEVDLPIKPGDRLLTIAVTNGGDGMSADWIMLGDPRFHLADRPR
jgi:hypothetical protein